jgi:hypothetical protein
VRSLSGVVSGNRVAASGRDAAKCDWSLRSRRKESKEGVFLDLKSFESLDVTWNSLPKGAYLA